MASPLHLNRSGGDLGNTDADPVFAVVVAAAPKTDAPMKNPPNYSRKRFWTPELWASAQKLKADGYPCAAIALRLGLGERQVSARFNNVRTMEPKPYLSPEMTATRDARYDARERRDLTGELMGDPPKGFSALDRQRAR